MKKLLATVIGALFVVSGLTLVGAPAQAADPYPGTIQTGLAVSHKARIHKGRKQKVTVEVLTAGNVTATGTISITITRIRTGKTISATLAYSGSKITYLSPRLKKRGPYLLQVTYNPTPGSVYKASSYQRGFKVKKRRMV